jgi:hypothetical protein
MTPRATHYLTTAPNVGTVVRKSDYAEEDGALLGDVCRTTIECSCKRETIKKRKDWRDVVE